MASAEGVTVRRRRLRNELRRLRETAGITQERVTEEMDWSFAKIIRIESGRVGVSTNDLKALLALYGVTEPRRVAELVELARQSRKRGWSNRYKEVLPSQYTAYIDFEAEASELRFFEPLMVHGMLQTEEYARGVVRETGLREFNLEEVDARVTARLDRQQLLSRDDPPRLWLVLGEAALRQRVGGAEVMRHQLARLTDVGDQRKVTVQVLPFRAGAHPGLAGPFSILSFPDPADTDIVYLENATGDLYLEEPDEIQRYTLIFEHLRAMALSPDDSTALIARVADEIERTAEGGAG